MSIFIRPASPPPRQPSPELAYAPLPLRARQRTMSSQYSLSTPATPPGLGVRHQHKPMLSVRSYDHLHEKASRSGTHHQEFRSRNTRVRSHPTASPPTTPRSLPLPSPSRSQFSDIPLPRRTLSNAIPYRSPPPSPTIEAPPPPVPPIPAFVLSPPAQVKPVDYSHPAGTMPIHLPDLDTLPSLSESTRILRKQAPAPSPGKHPCSPEPHRSVGMTCLKFFSTRNSKRRAGQASEA
ncbi:hypothetical protein LshimejAT787_0108170 [Lyophyllum shimeji]|uniref:Uncharacterized protein n=1 Tax=Lyophyllum shimeji TaxID=47721 RepID=A0A9P3PEF1_LYOSH|nr:hypothetical protein LshimejAT787_0108170 [Lyophyllum shimeji]